ncbi:acyltransferase [Kineobactrum sediminis]|uniref:Acyltransferase n=1 Tax=Kineobactrum sediminis TaxID=1905677 RepID=A0A2N5XY04_9GAMM|nr:acyltransferase family protein [Kineobactrum sediminis]PLW80992.1 acyltransferase [Kineobactrum sediminis]
MDYRREIDGLRALAVLPVILFHAGFEMFSGGFVGVDVFFVISGYLITTIILSELEQDKFSIVTFYERRARRILPALFFVMLVCIPFAWLWLLPSDMKDFSQSLLAVSLFASNILFWHESGYFEAAAELKPLLHTWSLAVEEQYYVLFPLFLMLCWPLGRRSILTLLSAVFVASFALAQWASLADPSAAFFILPTRGWELLIGSFAAFYLSKDGRKEFKKKAGEIAGWLGVALIFYAVFAYSEATPFPGVYALAPTVGTVLIILFATQQTTVGRFVGNRAFVSVGLISYSAYLWHQPLFAFAKHRSLEEPSEALLVALSIFALVFAYLSWRFVEAPFRKREVFTRTQIFYGALLGTLFFACVGFAGHSYDGVRERFSIPTSVYDSVKRTNRLDECFGKAGIHQIKDWYCTLGLESKPKDFVVFGDSHALSVLPAYDNVAKELDISGAFIGTSGCTPFLGIHALRSDQASNNCYELNQRVYRYVKDQKIPLVFLVARWTYYTDGGYRGNNFSYISTSKDGVRSKDESRLAFEDGLVKTLKSYSDLGVTVVIVPQVPQQISHPLNIYARSSRFPDRDVAIFSVSKTEHISLQSYVRVLFERNSASILEFEGIFCNDLYCPVGDNITSYYFDADHLSVEGSRKFEPLFRAFFMKR